MAQIRRAFRGVPCALLVGLLPFGVACSAGGDASMPPESPFVVGDGGSSPSAGGAGTAGASGAASSSGGTSAGGGDPGSSGGQGGVVFMGSGGEPPSGGAGGAPSGGSGACDAAPDQPVKEVCGNGLDENLNGFVDENCSCTGGTTQACFNGPPSQAGAPNCHKGTQTCMGPSEFPAWGPCENSGCDQVTRQEICDNGDDDNCNGLTDEGCSFDMTVTIDGDCISIPCPPQAPNPIGCNITMTGGDSRGCVAHAAGNPGVYFQEGNNCPFLGLPIGDVGHISGTLQCSTSTAAVTLGPDNCKINKPEPTYTDSSGGCPK